MNVRFFRLIGWISALFVLGLAGAADQGTLTAGATVWGSMLGVSGLLIAIVGQCSLVLRENNRQRRVPVRIETRQNPYGRRRR